MSHEPKTYELPHHLQRIFDSPEFEVARKEVNKPLEEFKVAVEKQLKSLTKEQRREELSSYEQALTKRVLAAATKHA